MHYSIVHVSLLKTANAKSGEVREESDTSPAEANDTSSDTDVQHHCTLVGDKKKWPQAITSQSPNDGVCRVKRRNVTCTVDMEARERGALARAAYDLPAATVRKILLSCGCHPTIDRFYMGGELVFPDL